MAGKGQFFVSSDPINSGRSPAVITALVIFLCLAHPFVTRAAQTTQTARPTPAATPPTVTPTPRATPAITPTPSTTPAATPLPLTSLPIERRTQVDQATPLSLNEALTRATGQISALTTADLNTRIASEDVRQARTAFFPKVTAPLSFIFTSPSLAHTTPREPSFISADAITVYQALLSAEGEIDTSGRLRSTLQRNIALVEAARAGGEVARRDLMQSVIDAYYNLALATAKRRGAESNLRASIEFEQNTRLQLEAGEVAPVDLVRARLQTQTRRDELIQARTDESVNADSLRVLTGSDISQPIAAEDLLLQLPVPDEIQRFSEATISTRPEFAQFAAERRAAELEFRVARAERRPQLTYSLSSGFISDSLNPGPLKNHAGVQAAIGFTIPIMDWGASRSREVQAQLRMQLADNARAIAERQFAQAFFTARAQALGAQDRIGVLRQSIVDAETNVSASIARYRAGEAIITEVVDAQNTLVTQRQALYQALFDYQTAKARWARAAGR
jgi:outer membrane protein